MRGGVRRQRFSAEPSHSRRRTRRRRKVQAQRGRVALSSLLVLARLRWGLTPPRRDPQPGASRRPPYPAARASAALPPPLSLPPGRRTQVLLGFVSGRRAAAGCTTRGQAQNASLNPLGHPAVHCWGSRLDGCHCCASFYFPPRFPAKSRGLGEGKENPVLKGAVQTDLSTAEKEDPQVGASSRARAGNGALVPAERRGGSGCGSARCPPSAGPALPRPPPPPAPRSPPHHQGPGNPPARFFCAVSAKLRGSWSFCSTIYRLRQHCEKEKAERWPLLLPSPAGSWERKAPAHDLSTQRASRPPAPGLQLAASPSQSRPERCQPHHVPARENQLPGAPRRPPGSVAAAAAAAAASLGWAPSSWAPVVAQASRTTWAPAP